jgi:protein Hikeshi
MVPGRPVRTDFVPVDATGMRFAVRFTCPGDIPGPLTLIRELVFFTLPHVPFPPDQGVMVYWQIMTAAATLPLATGTENSVSTGFEFLGCITPDCPSQVFATGWSEHEQVTNIAASGLPVILTIGASVEPLSSIHNVADGNARNSNNANPGINASKLHVAHKIALDLFNFMRSFDTGAAGNGYMTVPTNIFDRWYRRFENRFQRDPNFFLKNSNDS